MSITPTPRETLKQLETVGITGMITKTEPYASEGFTIEHSSKDTSRLTRLRFILIPCYDTFADYSEEKVALWDSVREFITNYFAATLSVKQNL